MPWTKGKLRGRDDLSRPVSIFADGLTNRQLEVLFWVATGLPNKGVANQLNISHQTIKNHVSRIMQTLHASDRTDAVSKAIFLHIINIDDVYRIMTLRNPEIEEICEWEAA